LTTRSSGGGVIGWSSLIGVGSDRRIVAISPAPLSPRKGGLPVAISYITSPREKMSVRASVSFPSNCSGAMYWSVPTRVPSAVRFAFSLVTPVSAETGATGSKGFARPKSRSFTPFRVSMTFEGLRSRCTIPS
jgi:hypothetical protein